MISTDAVVVLGLGFELRALHLESRCSAARATPLVLKLSFNNSDVILSGTHKTGIY
jgi:hypothetical protein